MDARTARTAVAALLGLGLGLLAPASAAAATIERGFADPPGQGFNDATPAAPVGGNTGTTVGQQRQNVVNRALDIWAQRLQSAQAIRVAVSFTSGNLPCTANAAAVGAASADHALLWRGAAGNPHPMTNVIYPAALYDRLAGQDGSPGDPDVLAVFNGRIGTPGCGEGLAMYLGLDGQTPRDGIDLLQVVLHEFSHAVGFSSLVDTATGNFATDSSGVQRADTFSTFVYDDINQKRWPAVTPAQRRTSLRSNGRLLWDGPLTTLQSARLDTTAGCRGSANRLRLYAPTTVIPSSSVSHWDTPCTPDLLMEPFTGAKPFLDITPAALADIGWGLNGSCGDGARNDGEQCDDGASNGTVGSSCSAICLDSTNPTCGNGVVAGNEQCDDGFANGSPFSCCTLGCTLKKAGSVCRPAASTCDVEETCTGASVTCPPDVVRPAGTVCHASAGACDVAEVCTGASGLCPDDLLILGGNPCRASTGQCDPAEYCDGNAVTCPADGKHPNGTGCSDENVCTTTDSCQAGVCQPGPPVICPDHGECYQVGVCDPVAAVCRSASKPNGTPCSIGACVQGVCTAGPPPMEPTPEPTVEPIVEVAPEPTVEPVVEPVVELAPEPVPEPAVEPTADGGVPMIDAAIETTPTVDATPETLPVDAAGDGPTSSDLRADATAPVTDLPAAVETASADAASDGRADTVPTLPVTAASDSSGCSCRTADDSPRSMFGTCGLLLALAFGRRRRR